MSLCSVLVEKSFDHAFGTQCSGLGQFNSPYSLTVDGEGNTSCRWAYKLFAFRSSQQKVDSSQLWVRQTVHGPLKFSHPTDITFNTINNKVYVVDNLHIQVLNSDLTFSSTFGKQGNGMGHPWGIACDSTGKVTVTSSTTIVFKSSQPRGGVLGCLGGVVRVGGNWLSLAMLQLTLVVCIWCMSHCVSVFTTEGQFVTSFGRKGAGPGEFNSPKGL